MENIEEIACKRPLSEHEQADYDKARNLLDRAAPNQPGTRNTGIPKDLVLAGDGPISQTHDAAAEVPPAAPAQAANAVGTTIQGPVTTNPDAPTASAGGPTPPPQTGPAGSSTGVAAPTAAGNTTGGTTSNTGSSSSPSTGNPAYPTQSAHSFPGKQHISGGVPELPEGAKLLQSSEHWFIFEHGGKQWVRFFAPEARSPNTAKKGGRGDGHDSTAAYLTPEGKIYVEEGQHRLNAVALESTTTLSSVPGHAKWLEYEFKGPIMAKGEAPNYAPGEPHKSFNRLNDWDGEDGY